MYKNFLVATAVAVAIFISGCAQPQVSYNYSDKNLLKNAGFEEFSNGKFNYWVTDGATVRHKDPKPHSGKNYLMGSKSNQKVTYTSQVVDLLKNGYSKESLDNSSMVIKFGGYQAGWKTQKDYGVIEVICQDKNHKSIAYTQTQGFYSNHRWYQRSLIVKIPKNTRYIKYTFIAHRKNGRNNDAYLDDAFIYIGKANSIDS